MHASVTTEYLSAVSILQKRIIEKTSRGPPASARIGLCRKVETDIGIKITECYVEALTDLSSLAAERSSPSISATVYGAHLLDHISCETLGYNEISRSEQSCGACTSQRKRRAEISIARDYTPTGKRHTVGGGTSGTLTGSDKSTESEALNDEAFLWSTTGRLNQPGLIFDYILASESPSGSQRSSKALARLLRRSPCHLRCSCEDQKGELSRASNPCRVLSSNHFSV